MLLHGEPVFIVPSNFSLLNKKIQLWLKIFLRGKYKGCCRVLKMSVVLSEAVWVLNRSEFASYPVLVIGRRRCEPADAPAQSIRDDPEFGESVPTRLRPQLSGSQSP